MHRTIVSLRATVSLICFGWFPLLLVACTSISTADHVASTQINSNDMVAASPTNSIQSVVPTQANAIPTPSPTPPVQQIPTLEPTIGAPVDPLVISPGNVAHLERMHHLGSGFALESFWSNDGKHLLVVSEDGISILDGETFAKNQFIATDVSYGGVAISPNGKFIAMAMHYPAKFENVLVWDANSGELLHTLNGHDGGALSVDFDPSGERLASSGEDGMVRLWDLSAGIQLHTFMGNPDALSSTIYRVVFDPSGRIIASSSLGAVTLLDSTTGEILAIIDGHEAGVSEIAFNQDGSFIVSGGYDPYLLISEVDTGKEIRKVEGLYQGEHNQGISSLDISHDGRLIVTGRCKRYVYSADQCFEGTIELWDLSSGNQIRELEIQPESVESVAFQPDGKMIATIARDDGAGIKLWDPISGEHIQTLSEFSPVNCEIAISNDNRTLATLHADGRIRIWDTENWSNRLLGESLRYVKSVQFSPDGMNLALNEVDAYEGPFGDPNLAENPVMHITDVHTGEDIRIIEDGLSRAIVFLDDSTVAASGNELVRVWDLSDGSIAHELELNPYWAALTVNPITNTLVMTSYIVELTGTPSYRYLKNSLGSVRALDFTPDGQLLASGAGNYSKVSASILFSDGMSGEQVHVIPLGRLGICSLRFSGDGKMVATGHHDGSIGIWRIPDR